MVDGAKPRCARVERFPLHANGGVQLGHANPSTTLRHYAKWIPSQGAVGGGVGPRRLVGRQVVAQAIENLGEPSGTRTRDPLIKSQVL